MVIIKTNIVKNHNPAKDYRAEWNPYNFYVTKTWNDAKTALEFLESIDVEKLAEEFAKNHSIYPTAQDDTEYGFKHGFQKAIELIKQQERWR